MAGGPPGETHELQLKLEVMAGPHQGRSFTCTGHENFLVGRSPQAHFRLSAADKFFSRLQFLIETNPPCCRLFDMNSTNGTFVNGQRITVVDLQDGDHIQGGETVIRVSLVGDWQGARQAKGPSPAGSTPARAVTPTSGTVSYVPASPAPRPAPTRPPDDSTQPPLPTIPGYRLLRELGRGGMGVVYLAMSEADQRPAAIKTILPAVVVSPPEVQQFLREIDILRRLRHPNVVEFRESGGVGGLLYFVMEYVPGTNAASLVKGLGPMGVGRAVRLVVQALAGLQHAHDEGFVHRDVKPANLLVGDRDGCKLADFGLARAYYASSLSGLTTMGQVGGTLPFMPPEQITDYRHAKPGTDQYAAAATLYFLLTGNFLFDFGDLAPPARLTKILTEEPVPLDRRRPGLPPALVAVIHRALSRDGAKRFRDCAALRQQLLPFGEADA